MAANLLILTNVQPAFLTLHHSVQTALLLPSSSQNFKERYPRDDLSKFLAQDPSLYDGLMAQFPITREHCVGFLKNVLPRTQTLVKEVKTCLEDVGDDCEKAYTVYMALLGSVQGGKLDGEKLRELQNLINETVANLGGLGPKAKDGLMHFTQFGTQQQSDAIALGQLLQRWKDHVPTDEVLYQQEQQIIADAQHAADEAMKKLREAEDNEKTERWRRDTAQKILLAGSLFNPFCIAAKYLVDPVGDYVSTSPEEWKRREAELNAQYENLTNGERERHARFLSIEMELRTLSTSLSGMVDVLKPALHAVEGIDVALSLLQTQFKKVADTIEDIPQNEDIDRWAILHESKEWEQLRKFRNENEAVKNLRYICEQLQQGTTLFAGMC